MEVASSGSCRTAGSSQTVTPSQFFMSYPVGSCMPCTASPLCGVGGTSLAYGVAEKDDESAECDAFGATAAAHATRLANATAGRPACYDALAVLYCAQEPVLSAASSCVEGAAGSSARTCSSSDYSSCSSHGREYTRGVHDCTCMPSACPDHNSRGQASERGRARTSVLQSCHLRVGRMHAAARLLSDLTAGL